MKLTSNQIEEIINWVIKIARGDPEKIKIFIKEIGIKLNNLEFDNYNQIKLKISSKGFLPKSSKESLPKKHLMVSIFEEALSSCDMEMGYFPFHAEVIIENSSGLLLKYSMYEEEYIVTDPKRKKSDDESNSTTAKRSKPVKNDGEGLPAKPAAADPNLSPLPLSVEDTTSLNNLLSSDPTFFSGNNSEQSSPRLPPPLPSGDANIACLKHS